MANGQVNVSRRYDKAHYIDPANKTPHQVDSREKVPHIDLFGRRSKMNTRDKRDEGQVLGRDPIGQKSYLPGIMVTAIRVQYEQLAHRYCRRMSDIYIMNENTKMNTRENSKHVPESI